MRSKRILTSFLVVAQFVSFQAEACPSFPNNITLEGATFSGLTIGTRKNGGFSMEISRAEDKEKDDRVWGRYLAAITAWEKSHETPDWDDKPAYERHRREQEAFQADTMKRLRDAEGVQFDRIRVVDGAVCFEEGSRCSTSGSHPLKDASGAIIGILEAGPSGVILFSVDAQGRKDVRKPYLKVVPITESTRYTAARIEAYDRSQQVGQIEVFGSAATRGALGGRGALDLRGKAFSSTGSGCSGGGVSEAPFSATGAQAPASTSSSGASR